MRIIAKRALREFWDKHANSEEPLKNWYELVRNQEWETPADVKEFRGNASILSDNRVVFNIKGNDYRLIVRIDYKFARVYIRFVGTHAEYDKIDAETI